MARRGRHKTSRGTSVPTVASSVRISKAKSRCVSTVLTAVLRPDLSSSRSPSPSPTMPSPDTKLSSNLESDSDGDVYSESDTNTEPDAEEPGGSGDTDESVRSDLKSVTYLDAELDSEAEAIMRDIAQFREDGPAKPKHTDRTTKLWMTESKFWNK